MIVKVTKKHIDDSNFKLDLQGYICDNNCPIALALEDKGKIGVSVQKNAVFFNDCHLYHDPSMKDYKRINKFIDNFDNRRQVRPFQFEMKHLRYKK